MYQFILVIAALLMGCQHIQTKGDIPTCETVLQQWTANCQLVGQDAIIADDGVGIVFQVVCGLNGDTPVLRLIGFSDSPTQNAEAIKAGAKDLGECKLGPNTRRVMSLDRSMPDMRASN